MEAPVNGFEPLQGIKQLQPNFPSRIGFRTELLGVLDGEPDPVDRDTSLVRHFEFNR
ncbi:MAG TPA: hypothetical protein VKX49_03240 [Bryobacteraceae bacterium]|nr:hypothetical protein [Bryobacteraceae bacterium]